MSGLPFPLEIRALAIAFFYAVGTGIGGAGGPWLLGALIDTGSRACIPRGGGTRNCFLQNNPLQSRENSAVRKAFSSGGTASGTLVDAKWQAVRVVWRHRVVVGSDGTAVSAIALTVAPLSVPPLSSLPVLSTAAMAGCSYQQRGLGNRPENCPLIVGRSTTVTPES
jgi:hypothetical protein